MLQPKMTFLGAAGTVTGSATLIEYQKLKVLVDCGMFQGPKKIREQNFSLYDKQLASSIDAVILTHAHIDHSGLLPKIYQLGFRGKIYSTQATFDLCKVMLPDSAYLQEEDAKRYHSSDKSRHPLYTVDDANACLGLFEVIHRKQWFEIAPGFGFQYFRAGHILGSSFVQISIQTGNGVRLVSFSGDLGNGRQYMIKSPEDLPETDDLVLESTYGDRLQDRNPPHQKIKQLVSEICASGGALVIPAFAVGRTQEILHILRELEQNGDIPSIPVFLDSPMALEATDIYLSDNDDLKLEVKEGKLIPPLSPSNFQRVRKMEDSIRLTHTKGPLIIISAAGMLTGGRILYHLKTRLAEARNIVLFVGYQAEDTKGRLLQSGLRTIRIHKEQIHVKAKVESIDSLSAHADSDDLVEWVSRINKPPKRVILNHGEPKALNALCYRLRYELDLDVIIAKQNESYNL
ncbi:MAG: MBL fold metallo-hydrolase [Bdellovibrionales bacterium]|nr:MBL fold metallo-hydrolase [Bdellovibrionales bacterium]